MKSIKFNKYTPVLVRWEDTTSDAKWYDTVGIDKAETTLVKTVGFFIENKNSKNKKRMLKLSHNMTSDGDSDYTVIPSGCIVEIKKLEVR